jgi:molybdopterin-binding protein
MVLTNAIASLINSLIGMMPARTIVMPITKQSAAAMGLSAGSPVCVSFKANAVHVIRCGVGHWMSVETAGLPYHLAADEYAARATVQKAREIMGTIEMMEAREARQRELARREEVVAIDRNKAEQFRKDSELLLMMFDELTTSDIAPIKRGFLLQDLLNRTFNLHEIVVFKSFQRNEGAEQNDGAFKVEGWHYLMECRWRKKLSDTQELDGLKGKIGRSGKQTMGLFLSINRWSDNVPHLLKQNPDKSILLMDGYDLRSVLYTPLDLKLRDFILAKAAKLSLDAEPFYSVKEYLIDLKDRHT